MAKQKEEVKEEVKPESAGNTEPVVVGEEVAPASEKRFRVTWKDQTGTFTARDEAEAWAMFCDSIKTYPSPKCTRTIEAV